MKTHEIREPAVLMTEDERMQIDANGITARDSVVPINCLSKRELQVAHKIMEGRSNKVIASELFISERTVKFHCANIYKKLNISSRSALIAGCFRTLYHEAVSL
ncbi:MULTISPECIES: helix-turn-helix domain-containing protein [Alteromonas]|jgi:DNA-binding NarL/FixJ family response regulator|uniref:helix-turn-helix domain-containing protein n=1 Tax=Alteromonas TaxID=226 RepID=UPI00241F976D|nr:MULTISPECIES: helix-turn-helix transcriptional regulator [Alteromonas]MBR9785038.1 helix-turn-helix transcriptional regulator [Gammaproteobacteria bacterium]NQY17909.1 helix-turn-helix transcriptional regulator [Alteromonas sp.]|tara:strand:+ start:4127 stop:4438 length:312 start_codon:yes stop_codon:yes gene_type:complete